MTPKKFTSGATETTPTESTTGKTSPEKSIVPETTSFKSTTVTTLATAAAATTTSESEPTGRSLFAFADTVEKSIIDIS